MNGNVQNTLNNNCWFWSSVRIIQNYVLYNGIPKELSNEIIKKIINSENVSIDEYDKETMKQSDLTNSLDGNAVEFLTVNGFYYTECLPIRRANCSTIELTFNKHLPISFLLQFPGHFVAVILEDGDYILYDQTGKYAKITKLPFDKETKKLHLPICGLYTNIYIYMNSRDVSQ